MFTCVILDGLSQAEVPKLRFERETGGRVDRSLYFPVVCRLSGLSVSVQTQIHQPLLQCFSVESGFVDVNQNGFPFIRICCKVKDISSILPNLWPYLSFRFSINCSIVTSSSSTKSDFPNSRPSSSAIVSCRWQKQSEKDGRDQRGRESGSRKKKEKWGWRLGPVSAAMEAWHGLEFCFLEAAVVDKL